MWPSYTHGSSAHCIAGPQKLVSFYAVASCTSGWRTRSIFETRCTSGWDCCCYTTSVVPISTRCTHRTRLQTTHRNSSSYGVCVTRIHDYFFVRNILAPPECEIRNMFMFLKISPAYGSKFISDVSYSKQSKWDKEEGALVCIRIAQLFVEPTVCPILGVIK